MYLRRREGRRLVGRRHRIGPVNVRYGDIDLTVWFGEVFHTDTLGSEEFGSFRSGEEVLTCPLSRNPTDLHTGRFTEEGRTLSFVLTPLCVSEQFHYSYAKTT